MHGFSVFCVVSPQHSFRKNGFCPRFLSHQRLLTGSFEFAGAGVYLPAGSWSSRRTCGELVEEWSGWERTSYSHGGAQRA